MSIYRQPSRLPTPILTAVIALHMLSGTLIAQVPVDSNKLVRVLSFNILHGETTVGDFNLDVLADVIKDVNPDFVALQEVDFKANRSKGYDLATELGWRTKMAPIFAPAMPFDGGEYGEGILSRYSFVSTRTIPLPFVDGEEPRAALEVVVVLPLNDTIAFAGTHFAHEGDTGRMLQASKINEVFAQNEYPTILAGDLNAVPGSGPIRLLQEFWTTTCDEANPASTFPSHNPDYKIDYVLYSPRHKWRTIERKVICNTIASDHCAYLVTLELLD